MKENEVARLQRTFIAALTARAQTYVDSLPKDHLSVVLLSGSVARGDFFPGRLGGMVDMTVFAKPEDSITAENLFGPNEDPGIPYHCVKRDGTWFQIWFTHPIDAQGFRSLPEPRKFALLESRLLWQHAEAYTLLKRTYEDIKQTELVQGRINRLGYITHLLSEYKVDRWTRRNEPGQLHANLNEAVIAAIGFLYNLNGRYVPANDRLFYYAGDLAAKPESWDGLLVELMTQKYDSMEDYERREKLFRSRLLPFLEAHGPT